MADLINQAHTAINSKAAAMSDVASVAQAKALIQIAITLTEIKDILQKQQNPS